MSDYIRNQNPFLLAESTADNEDVSLLREETQESQESQQTTSPSFYDLVSRGEYDSFQYTHPDDTVDFKRSAAKNFMLRGKSSTVVFAMAIGHPQFLKLTGEPPFTETKQKVHTQVFNPPNQILAEEVVRRAHFFSHDEKYEKLEDNPLYDHDKGRIHVPKPAGYSRDRLLGFLQSKTIKLESTDLAFMWSYIRLYAKNLSRELHANKLKPDTTMWDRSGWEGLVPNVRLIEIVLSDEFREDFLNRNGPQSRQELDARGTESQNLSFWEKVRCRFNDESFETTSCPLDCNWGRQIFLDIHDCNWKELDALGISPIPDANICKLHYTNLNNKLGTIFKKWKASGNGDDQVTGTALEEAEFGTVDLELLPTQAGNRIDFLGNHNIAVMYLWYSLIRAGAFLYSQSEFPDYVQADGRAPKIPLPSGGSSIESSYSDKKMPAIQENAEIVDFSAKIDRLNDTILLSSKLDRMIDDRREINTDLKDLSKDRISLIEKIKRGEVEVRHEQNQREKEILQELVDEYQKEFDKLELTITEKKRLLEELVQKIAIVDHKIYSIEDKTPKRSGNASRRVPPSAILVTEGTEEVGGRINFDTPATANTTPTATSTQVARMIEANNKRKRSEQECPESIDLLAQETETYDYDDSDNDDLPPKVF
jgi:hypothetical protein